MNKDTFREVLVNQYKWYKSSRTIMVEAAKVADIFENLIEMFDDMSPAPMIETATADSSRLDELQTLYAQLADKVGEIENIVSDQDDRIESLEKVTSNLEDATSDLEDIRKDIVDMDAVRGRYVDLTGIVSRHAGILQSIEEAFK